MISALNLNFKLGQYEPNIYLTCVLVEEGS